MKLTLDLNDLAVETFAPATYGDPSQWTQIMAPPPDTEDDCDDVYVAAATHEYICTTTK